MFYHDQDVAIHRPLSVVISSVFILDPSLLPLKKSPLEEEIQDSKTLYYYPQSVSIHTKRNYIGLVEGVMVFTDGFGEGHSDCLMVDADSHSLEAKIVEKNLIIAVICIGAEARPVLEAFCRHFSLFYGRFSFWRQEDGHMKKEFRAVMDHFVEMFTALGSTGEMIDKINPSRFLPVGIERFGLQKTQFIVTNQIDNLLKDEKVRVDHWALFYKSWFIFGDIDYPDVSQIKDYLFGVGRNPAHLSFLDKFSDFRKCGLDPDEDVRRCTYGLLNLAKETKDVLAGEMGEGKDKERFSPMIYLPIRNQFEQVKPPSYHSDFFEHLNFERSETETKNDEVEDGLRKYHLSILKVGNFTLTMLTAPSNSTLRSNFQSVRRSVKEILDHCEKLVLNQLSLVESAVQKKSASVSALVFNEVNQAVVYYPFAKFNVGLLPKTLAGLLIEKFDVMMKEEARGTVVDLECSADGHFVQMTRWNQRTVIIYTDDKKVAYKEVVANVNSFRQSLSDIFL